MKSPVSFRSLAAAALFVLAGLLAPSLARAAAGGNDGHVTVSIQFPEPFIYYFVAPPPALPVNAPPGSTVELSVPLADADIRSISWLKDDVAVSSAKKLTLADVTANEAGRYSAVLTTAQGEWHYNSIPLRVVAPVRQQFLNLSTRGTISASQPVIITGTVIPAPPGRLREYKTVLVRAVGPSLASLGVSHPLAAPQLKIYDRDGREFSQVRIALWLGYNETIIARRVGAFPLLPGARDVAMLIDFPAGPYTFHISSADGGTGDVLFELYEVGDDLLYPEPGM